MLIALAECELVRRLLRHQVRAYPECQWTQFHRLNVPLSNVFRSMSLRRRTHASIVELHVETIWKKLVFNRSNVCQLTCLLQIFRRVSHGPVFIRASMKPTKIKLLVHRKNQMQLLYFFFFARFFFKWRVFTEKTKRLVALKTKIFDFSRQKGFCIRTGNN